MEGAQAVWLSVCTWGLPLYVLELVGGAACNPRRVTGRGEQFVEIAENDLSVVPTSFHSCTEHTIIEMFCGRGWVVKVRQGCTGGLVGSVRTFVRRF